MIHEWVGKLQLSPEGDEWFETEDVPALIINVEGNFDTIQNGLRNQGVLQIRPGVKISISIQNTCKINCNNVLSNIILNAAS